MRIIRLLLVVMTLSILTDTHAARMSDYADNTTPNADVYFIGVDPNDTSQTVRGSNYRYSLASILCNGLLDATFKSLTVSGTGDSWLELENNTSFTDSLTGKYGIRFYNGVLQQILNGTATNIGSASIQELASDPAYTDLDTGEMAVSTVSGDLFIKTATGLYTIAGTYAADPTTPTLTSLTIPTSGETATAVFSEAMTIGAGGSGGWTLNTPTNAMTYASGAGTDTIIFNLASTILSTDTPTVSYTQPTNGFESADDGVDLASITNASVTNNSTQTGVDYSDILLYWGAENSSTADKPAGLTATKSTLTYQTSPKLAGSYSAKYTSSANDRVQWTNTSDAIFNRSSGRVGGWVSTGATFVDDNVYFEAHYDASNYVRFRNSGTSGGIEVLWAGAGVTHQAYTSSLALSAASEHYIEFSYGAEGIEIYIDGAKQTITKSGTYTAMSASPANGTVSIGASSQIGSAPAGASYDQLFISNDSARDLYAIREVTNVD